VQVTRLLHNLQKKDKKCTHVTIRIFLPTYSVSYLLTYLLILLTYLCYLFTYSTRTREFTYLMNCLLTNLLTIDLVNCLDIYVIIFTYIFFLLTLSTRTDFAYTVLFYLLTYFPTQRGRTKHLRIWPPHCRYCYKNINKYYQQINKV